MSHLLEIRGLRVYYNTPQGTVKAVDDVSFQVDGGMRFGLIGESGSGKSTIALAIMRLIRFPGRIESGEVWLDGENLLSLSDLEMRQRRLSKVAMIMQGAMNSLNPVIRIRQQFADGLRSHGVHLAQNEERRRLGQLLERVGLRADVGDMYPHVLSGGMKQRVCIAFAISLAPKLIIADEPTSALDVVVQRQVMETLRSVQEELGAAVILIGHDMGLMAQFASSMGVMYAGKLVEEGPSRAILQRPQHPYTQILMETLPSLDAKEELKVTSGAAPSARERPTGCVFAPRCAYVMPHCHTVIPEYRMVARDQWAACHLHDEPAAFAQTGAGQVSEGR